MSDFYRFPAMSVPSGFTNEDQAEKLWEETTEAFNALRDWTWDCDAEKPIDEPREEDRTDYGMELMDVIHVAETALRMEFSDAEVDGLREAVEEKNRRRGYY